MSPLEIGGFVAALAMGVVLGLVGAGGSILTVPILVYLFGLLPSHATGVSLAVVGGVALIGAGMAWRKGQFDGKAAFVFGLPSVVVAFLIRRWLMPILPESFGVLSKDSVLLILFATIMFVAAKAMLSKRVAREDQETGFIHWLAGGVGAGLITGVLGAGGGFVIVPALNAGMGLPMRKAIGTSLAVIAMNSAAGLVAEWLIRSPIQWGLAAKVGGVALIGMALGMSLQSQIPGNGLKKGFGFLIILVALFILGQEFFGTR